MDSTNLHHHHENHQVVVDECCNSSSASLPSSCFSVADNNNDHAWRSTPTFFLNNNNNNGNIHATCNSDNEGASNSLNNPILQEMGFLNDISLHQSTSHHQDKIKDEQPSSSSTSSHHHLDHNNPTNFAKFSDMLLLKNTSLSTSSPLLFQPSTQYQSQNSNLGLTTTFSQIFPSVNISNMSNNNDNNSNNMSSPISSCSSTIDHHQMANNHNNMQGGLDLFATARLLSGGETNNHFNHPAPPSNNDNNNLLELFKGSPPQFTAVDHDLQQSNDLKRCNNIVANNVSSFNNNGSPLESKNYMMEQKSTTNKKQRFESRASCPPFKVRKEKLGDRITALQQLVSPFGKTDTASVLMEAIGYIKFLQNQVETLSVPYMKLAASRSKSSNTQRVVSDDEEYSENGEPKLTTDLKSRGLCLVPISCMSYINLTNNDNSINNNAGVWPPPNFNLAGGF